MGDELLSLFYPNLCLACQSNAPINNQVLCLRCSFKLPQTQFHLHKENAFTERFWGRLSLEAGASLYRFTKGGHVQNLIHHLKYRGRREVGIKCGEYFGHQLKKSPLFSGIDLIIPVPLHPKKKHQRGYNQSDMIAKGLSKSMSVPWAADILIRKTFTETQTQKSRMERLENVAQAFCVTDPDRIKGKHILLVDDVITTGATLEICALKILEVPNTKVSMVTLAFADV
ncbi:MAG: ComF family protein [Bacteroidetes bacterium]|nr:MAG: ComF family protein [Bacteroidota bacterium]